MVINDTAKVERRSRKIVIIVDAAEQLLGLKDFSTKELHGILGVLPFIKRGITYSCVGEGVEQEYVVVEVWLIGGNMVIVNFYNPCKRLELLALGNVEGQDRRRVMWCGNFNAHSTLWGWLRTDVNGQVLEELLDEKGLVSLNDDRGTRIDPVTGNESALDLTLSSSSTAGRWS
jgi:hypothetical protein